MIERYAEFPIEVAGVASRAQVRVLGPVPGGEMTAREAVEAPVDLAAIAKLVRRVGQRSKLEREDLFALGTTLGAILLPGRVRDLFERSRLALDAETGLRLRLSALVPELAALPWEYAHVASTPGEPTQGDFLALRPEVSLVRHQHTGAPAPSITKPDRVRIVVALASPETDGSLELASLDVSRDREAIQRAVSDLETEPGTIEVAVVDGATRTSLADALMRADIFHFAGHGVFETLDFDEEGRPLGRGAIVLEGPDGTGERLDGGELALLLAGAGTRLAVLGACDSAARDALRAWSGVAPALVRENVPAVVAMQLAIRDTSASRFMTQLYASILAGRPLDLAVHAGRRAILGKDGVESRDWGVPVVYLRATDGVLFPLEEEGSASDAPYVRLRKHLGTVLGTSMTMRIRSLTRGRVDITEDVDVVGSDGTHTTLEIDSM